MEIFLNAIILILCILGLWGGAVWVVDSASRIAKRLGLSDLVIGLTVVAIATSAPEFSVTITAAMIDKSSISVGNVIGSNIFNLYFIMGLLALFGTVTTNSKIVYRDGSVLILSSLMLLFFLRDNVLDRWEGIVLFGSLIVYIIVLILAKEKPEEIVEADRIFKWYYIPQLIFGVAVIVIAGEYFVKSASDIARIVGISEWTIGVTIVAAGTSAPEMATSIVALTKGKVGISAGNLIGSDIFNLYGVLGLAGIIRPLPIDPNAYTSIIVLFAAILLFVVFMRTGYKVSKTEGVLLLIIVAIRWYFDFSIN